MSDFEWLKFETNNDNAGYKYLIWNLKYIKNYNFSKYDLKYLRKKLYVVVTTALHTKDLCNSGQNKVLKLFLVKI